MSDVPFATIVDARRLARDLHARSSALGYTEGETLLDAAKALWRAISVLEATPPRRKAGEARTRRSLQRALRQQ